MTEVKSRTNLLSIETIILELEESIKKNELTFSNNLENFLTAFNDKYPKKNNTKGRAEAITWALMNVPLFLYAFNLNGAAIIELHSILERYTMRELIGKLNVPTKQNNFVKLFERHTLPDFALILSDLEILDEEDIKFIKKLNRLRNGVAHKNPKPIYDMINSGKPFHMLDIDDNLANFDIQPFIIHTIDVLVKMSKYNDSKIQ